MESRRSTESRRYISPVTHPLCWAGCHGAACAVGVYLAFVAAVFAAAYVCMFDFFGASCGVLEGKRRGNGRGVIVARLLIDTAILCS